MIRRASCSAILAALAMFAMTSNVLAADETAIDGTFDGCDWDKTYPLQDGRTLTCRMYKYHYAYAPKVVVIDSFTVEIDGDEYSASVQ